MWKVFVRAIIAFAFSIFGRTFIALVVAMLLSFATALLIDFRMYVSAGLAGVLALAAAVLFVIQYRRQIVASRRRSKQQAEAAQRRAASAEVRADGPVGAWAPDSRWLHLHTLQVCKKGRRQMKEAAPEAAYVIILDRS